MTTIVGIRLDNRVANSTKLQEKLTQNGCIIKTRLGLHDVSDDKCPMNGIILLEITEEEKAKALVEDIRTIDDITVETMSL